jgi:hypothetical protein
VGEQGDACQEDEECASGSCFFVPVLGGLCGECKSDGDCADGGCNNPNPITGDGAVCNEGELGGGCDSSDACQAGLRCERVLDIAGILVAETCSECGLDGDCPGSSGCAPSYEFTALTGYLECVPPFSRANGLGCSFPGSDVGSGTGDQQCASGLCAEVDIMGLASAGICADCEFDIDCPPGQSCTATQVDIESGDVTAGFCQ